MRIDIKTKGKVSDPDVRALYIIEYAMKISSPKMRSANISFIKSKWKV